MRKWIICLALSFGTGCSSNCQPEPTSELHETQLKNLVVQWQSNPKQEHLLKDIGDLCAKALQTAKRPRDFDIFLADTVSNILLRPDLGIPLYTPHMMTLSHDERDGYLNALLRAQDLKTLSHQLRDSVQSDIAYEHPSSHLLAFHAQTQREITWEIWLHELNAVTLYEAAPMVGRRSLPQPVTDLPLLFDTMRVLLPDWSIRVVIAESRLQTDSDPWKEWTKTPTLGGRKQIAQYGDFGTDGHPSASFWTDAISERSVTIVFEWQHTTGRRHISCIDGKWNQTEIKFTTACSHRFEHLIIASKLQEAGNLTDPESFNALLIPSIP